MRRVEADRVVELIVAKRHWDKAIDRLSAEFPEWSWRDGIMKLQLEAPNKAGSIHLMKPKDHLACAIFKHTRVIRIENQACRIPSLEMALAMKFRDAVSIYVNEEDRVLHLHEFYRLANRHRRRNEAILASLAELVIVTGARSMRKMIRQAATPSVL